MDEYSKFVAGKKCYPSPSGVAIAESDVNSRLFDWQRRIVKWAVGAGKCAIFADCGLGKTVMQLEFARLTARESRKPALVLTPVAVAPQTIREAEKFSIDADIRLVKSRGEVGQGVNVTNYEKLHLFDPSVFGSVVLDESSILKAFTGKIKQRLCEAFKATPFRLACTATPAPNDRMELGNHSEFLGVMPSGEMLERWFINDTMKAGGYRLRGHAVNDFWEWVSSWAVCISSPADLGFSSDGYKLPPLNVFEHIVHSDSAADGFLFPMQESISATKVHKEKRRVLQARVDVVAGLANNSSEAWAIWCDTDYEADTLVSAIPDAVEVRGSHKESVKEDRLNAFSQGRARVIVTKPEIAGYGLNWQHCHNTTWFAGYSFERFYQAIRRLWRFGQEHAVNVHTVMSDLEQSIADVVKRKQAEHEQMFCEMALRMRSGMLERVMGVRTLRKYEALQPTVVPEWLIVKGGSV